MRLKVEGNPNITKDARSGSLISSNKAYLEHQEQKKRMAINDSNVAEKDSEIRNLKRELNQLKATVNSILSKIN
jgi:hypothetical protein